MRGALKLPDFTILPAQSFFCGGHAPEGTPPKAMRAAHFVAAALLAVSSVHGQPAFYTTGCFD